EDHLDRQRNHREQEKHHERVLQQAHAAPVPGLKPAKKREKRQSASQVKSAHDNSAENSLAQVAGNAEQIGQVAVHLVNDAAMVPGLSRPEPLPTRPTYEGPDQDHRNPQKQKTKGKRSDRKAPLPQRVI